MERKSDERERSGSLSGRNSLDGARPLKKSAEKKEKKDKKEKKLGTSLFIIVYLVYYSILQWM